MKYDSSREHITLGLDVPGFSQGDDFGSHVARGPTAEEEIAGQVRVGGKAKIHNHRVESAISGPQHDVLGLKIAVHKAQGVHVLQSL